MIRRNKTFRNLLAGWTTKVVALIAAILLFIYGYYASHDVRKVTVPIKVMLPIKMVATSVIPTTVEVKITGRGDVVYLVNPEMIKAYVDFSQVKESGIATAPVVFEFEQKAFVTGSITLEAMPSQYRIMFERSLPATQ